MIFVYFQNFDDFLLPKSPILWIFDDFSNENAKKGDFSGQKLLNIIKIFQKYYFSLNAANCPSCNTVQESFASDLWHLKTLEQWFGERIFNSQFALQLVKKHAFFCHLKPGDHSKQGGSFFLDSSLSLRFLPLVESWGGKTPFFPSVFI